MKPCRSYNSNSYVEMLLNCVTAAFDLINRFCDIALGLVFPFIFVKVTFQLQRYEEVGDLE